MDAATIAMLGDLVSKVGVPAALVVLLFVVYIDLRPVLTVVVKEWLVLHYQQRVVLAKIEAGQINPPAPPPPPTIAINGGTNTIQPTQNLPKP
jgi:hypothetical protein